jgi:hypothetical protein
MSEPLYVSYYTVGTPYEKEAERLKLSLEAMGLPFEHTGVKSLGSWQKNTQFKADFLSDALNRHPGRPLVYLDVDALVLSKPDWSVCAGSDLAAVVWFGAELLSGTVYLGNTPGTRTVVDAWIKLNAKYPEKLPNGREAWDQRTLFMAVKETGVRFIELPRPYTAIIELSNRYFASDPPPVIIHTRGSLRFKDEINAGVGT